MEKAKPFYFGNAAADQIRNTGWFIGQFVPPELGLRHQTDVEVNGDFIRTGTNDQVPGQTATARPSRY